MLSKYFKDVKTGYESLIQPQLNDWFIPKAESILIEALQNPDRQAKIGQYKKLVELISERFGIPTRLVFMKANYATEPIGMGADFFDTDDVMKSPMMEFNFPDFYKKVKYEYEKLKSMDFKLDLKNAKVIGLENWARKVPIYINSYLLDNNYVKSLLNSKIVKEQNLDTKEDKYKFIADTIIAILLHEIGHIFTFLEVFGLTVKNNLALLESVMLQVAGKKDKSLEVLINTFGDKSNVKLKDKNAIVAIVVYNVYNSYKNGVDELKQLGSVNTYYNNSETAADSFAVKFGMGDYLVYGLVDLFGVKEFFTNFILFSNAVILLLGLILAVTIFLTVWLLNYGMTVFSIGLILSFFSIIFGLVMLDARQPGEGFFPYDKLHDRVEKIKLETIRMLRTYKIDKNDIKTLVTKIENIEKELKWLTEEYNSNKMLKSIINLFNSNFGITLNNDKEFVLLLQRLEDNDLHFLANKLNVGFEEYLLKISKNKLTDILKDVKNIDDLNNVLEKYGLQIDLKHGYYILEELKEIKEGYFSVVFDLENDKVLILTLEPTKLPYYLLNPKLTLDNYDAIKLKHKTVYVMLVDKVYINKDEISGRFGKQKYKDFQKELNALYDSDYELEVNYGSLRPIKRLTVLIANAKKYGYENLVNDLSIARDIAMNLIDDYNSFVDIHPENLGVNTNGEIVIIDPIAILNSVAKKTDNSLESVFKSEFVSKLKRNYSL